jgi:hypothetical protein
MLAGHTEASWRRDRRAVIAAVEQRRQSAAVRLPFGG